ncbi:MAG TPA: hypothetical protein VHI71_09335 [Actinomycetota bacterium]|nr:hypothetical protein [Actinomycetota bacterium]
MNERGAAVVETLLLALILLVPLVWALSVLADLHRAALATTAAAREAGFDAARATSPAEAERRVEAAIATALSNHGLDPARADVEWAAAGLERGAALQLRVSYDVPVVRAPFLGSVSGPSIAVSAAHVARIDPYRSRP